MDRSKAFLRVLAAGFALLVSPICEAYVPTVTSGGAPVTWRGPPKLNLAGNPRNQSGLDPEDFRAAVVRSLLRWAAASGGSLGFDYWQGTSSPYYTGSSDYNGLSNLYFASNQVSGERLPSNVLGLTQVWYDPHSGRILETDVVLNDRAFQFTMDPRDTSGYGSGGPGAGSRTGMSKVFVENVLTHELGHAFGLSHSGGLQSAMLFMESPEQAHLGCDEHTGIHVLYPSGDAGARGEIAGKVVTEAGKPVFGAHVVAISRRRGTVMATAISDSSGQYRISALEPGAYFLLVEPYFAGPGALPVYYSGMNSAVCGGQEFVRGFLTDSDGFVPTAVEAAPGRSTAAPALVARCGPAASVHGASIRLLEGAGSLADAPLIYRGAGPGFGATLRFDSMQSSYLRLNGLSGRIEIHAVGYSIYSPARASIRLLSEATGAEVRSARIAEEVYTGESGYVNYDSVLTADGIEPGNYTLEISPDRLPSTRYPAGNLALDAAPFLLVTGSVNEATPALAGVIAENARCRMNENFAAYQSPPGDPPRGVLEEEKEGVGFCGTLTRDGFGSGRGGPPRPGALLGWFAPWLLMLALVRLARARASRRAGSTAGVPLAFL
jgi:hypothetical protein